MESPQNLEPPERILRELVWKLPAHGRPLERVYLSSRNPKHRWDRSAHADLADEFRYKAIWVASLLRKHLGSPDHVAFLALRHSSVSGVRAAAWFFGATIGYVVEREQRFPRRGRRVILGATAPRWPARPEPEGIEAHDAVWILSARHGVRASRSRVRATTAPTNPSWRVW